LDRKRILHSLELIYASTDVEIDCERLKTLLPTFVDIEIAGGDTSARLPDVHSHLAQCPDCAAEYTGLVEVAQLEAQGTLPQAEESLEAFEAEPTPEPDEIATVPAR
jgi:hypothetical protein